MSPAVRVCLPAALGAALLAGPPALAADLTTFGYGNARLGSTGERMLTAADAGNLLEAWHTGPSGAVNTQPLVLHGVRTGRRRRTLVLVGDERGWVRAIDARRGRLVWKRRLGTRIARAGCPAGPDDHLGVTGTLVADRARGRVYAVDALGRAWALRLSDGVTISGWPLRAHPAGPDFVWSALSLSQGRLYVPISSLCDSGHYRGGITMVDTRTRRVSTWSTTAATGSYAGGIWGWGGASIDGSGDLFVATGNSLGTDREDDGHAEQVVRLSPDLTVEQSDNPLRPPFAAGDRDFGSTPVLIDAPGCPAQLVALNKTGEMLLYARDAIAQGPQQRVAVAGATGIPLYGEPAYDPATRLLVLTSPSAPGGSRLRAGIQAFRLTRACRLALVWQTPWVAPAGSAPTIAGGVVYLASGPRSYLQAYRLRDGRKLWQRTLSARGAFATPAVVAGRLYEGDWAGRVWAFRLPRR